IPREAPATTATRPSRAPTRSDLLGGRRPFRLPRPSRRARAEPPRAAPRRELRRLAQTGRQDAERGDEGTETRTLELRPALAHVGEAARVGRERLPVREEAAPLARHHLRHLPLRHGGITGGVGG